MKQNYIEIFVNKENNITICYGKAEEGKQSIEVDMISIDPDDAHLIRKGLEEALDNLDPKHG